VSIEEMENPKQTMLKAMVIAIVSVMVLYVTISIVVFGNLSLGAITQAKDYALAEAAKPLFGEWGFKIIAITALLATASAINATLYAATEISYTMAKRGELPKQYDFKVIHSYEGLIISTLIIIPMILFFDLTQITTIAALIVLLVQGITHIGHLRRIKQTQAHPLWIGVTVLATLGIAGLMMVENFTKSPNILYYLLAMIGVALVIELLLRIKHQRALKGQSNANA
jgi:amino acid transporter